MYAKVFITAILVGLANTAAIEKRQTAAISKEFSQGGCKPVLFAFARGSTEIGNMGTIAGTQTSDILKKSFSVATEGIDYAASLEANVLPGGTDAASKQAMVNVLNAMATTCPTSVIVTGGYSQGSAVNHRAIESLSAAVQARIAGVVLYGDTQKQQDNSQIFNFPVSKVKIICQPGDLVCFGTLIITAAHLTYAQRAAEGAAFLVQQIKIAQAKIEASKAAEIVEDAADEAVKSVEKIVGRALVV